MKTNSSKIFVKIAAWFFAVAAVCVVLLISLFSYLSKPVSKTEDAVTYSVKVGDGQTVSSVAGDLKSKNLIKSQKALYFATRFNLYNREKKFVLKSGVYRINSAMSLKEIYLLLESGKQEYITVIIPEGLTMSKIGSILESENVCLKTDFLSACRDTDLLNKYSIPADSFEGYLFPDTYFFTPSMNASGVVEILADNFFKKITLVDSLAEKSPDELFKILTLASIVEREYRVKEEAPLIASVFTNRINHGIGLYSCATIEYIITEINLLPHPEKITYDDLKIDSPYNTYKWAGLTPGPISNPGLVALSAAANPAKTNYYYFVLTDPQEGRHTFSSNFDQHKAAENISYTSK